MIKASTMLKRWLPLLLVLQAAFLQAGCAVLAAGAAGGVIGHEIAEERDEDDGDLD